MTGPRASVIIMNYNYGRFLGAAIDSALAQTYPDVEVVVVDDGSTDHSRDVIAAAGDRIVPVLKANGGQASALNAGFLHSTGDVILLLDADDMLLPTTCERVVAAVAAQPDVAKVHYTLEVVDAAGTPTGRLLKSQPLSSGDLRRPSIERFQSAYCSWSPTSGNAFPRRVLERLLPMPEEPYRLCADHYPVHLAPLLGPVIALDGPGAQYRKHGANNYSRHEKERLTERFLARVRSGIVRNRRTRAQQRRLAEELGLPFPEPDRDKWFNDARRRLISLKLDPAHHPVSGDSLWRVTWSGVTTSLAGGGDNPIAARRPHRLLQAGWFVAIAVAPQGVARRAIEETLFPRSGDWLGRTIASYWRRQRVRSKPRHPAGAR